MSLTFFCLTMHFSFAYYINSMPHWYARTHPNTTTQCIRMVYSDTTFYLSYLYGVLHKIVLFFFILFSLTKCIECLHVCASLWVQRLLMLFTRLFASKFVCVRFLFGVHLTTYVFYFSRQFWFEYLEWTEYHCANWNCSGAALAELNCPCVDIDVDCCCCSCCC